jgi:hypothetical protein
VPQLSGRPAVAGSYRYRLSSTDPWEGSFDTAEEARAAVLAARPNGLEGGEQTGLFPFRLDVFGLPVISTLNWMLRPDSDCSRRLRELVTSGDDPAVRDLDRRLSHVLQQWLADQAIDIPCDDHQPVCVERVELPTQEQSCQCQPT